MRRVALFCLARVNYIKQQNFGNITFNHALCRMASNHDGAIEFLTVHTSHFTLKTLWLQTHHHAPQNFANLYNQNATIRVDAM